MKKILLITIFALWALAKQTVVTLACDQGYPPYSYKEGSQAKGIYVDIIKKAFDKMPQYKLKIIPLAWKRAIWSVQKGRVVGFFPPYFNKERLAWTKFSKPILAETTIVFAKAKTLKNRKKFPDDFVGLTVCMNRGFSLASLGGEKFAKMVDSGSINIKWGNTNKTCLNQLQRNRADFYINDRLISLKGYPSIKRGLEVKHNNGYIGWTLQEKKYPYEEDLIKQFNKVITQMKKDGEIDAIVKKYQNR
ncbi:MAG: amino acid ABC transporter substrate-binding protein [Epsilonproteobacteria bacterium]|nr:amino acid ABC transporter substrate-binding protein [Campylobacterota bacterium]